MGNRNELVRSSSGSGIGYGGMTSIGGAGCSAAVLFSWTLNHSVGWALLHGVFGWFYLLYLCMGFGGGFPA